MRSVTPRMTLLDGMEVALGCFWSQSADRREGDGDLLTSAHINLPALPLYPSV